MCVCVCVCVFLSFCVYKSEIQHERVVCVRSMRVRETDNSGEWCMCGRVCVSV